MTKEKLNKGGTEITPTKYNKSVRKKLAILGTAPTVKDAPYNNPEFDIWGVAHCTFLSQVTRLDAIFEIHLENIWREDHAPFDRFPDANVWFLQDVKDIKNAKKYPFNEIFDKYKVNDGFSGKDYHYISSSLPYLVCMAMEEGYEEIHIYGVHFLQDEEYYYQRPCLEYYLGMCHAKGIKLYIPHEADILKFGLTYGVQDGTHDISNIEARYNEFQGRIHVIAQKKDEMFYTANYEINKLTGMKIVWDNFAKDHPDREKALTEINNKINEISMKRDQLFLQGEREINQLIGAAEDCKYWARRLGKELKK